MSDLEAQVVAMLRRRAGDIAAPADGDEPALPDASDGSRTDATPARGRGPERRTARRRTVLVGATVASVAVVAVVAGVIAALVSVDGERPTLTAAGTGGEPSTGSGSPATDTGDDATTATPPPTTPPLPDPTLDEVLAGLPERIDVRRGSLVFTDPGLGTVDQVVDAYLADRLPDLPVEVRRIEGDGRLTLFRWSVEAANVSVRGSVVTRYGDFVPGVVAATTDGVTMTVDRRLDVVTAEVVVTDPRSFVDAMAVADVLDIGGAPVAGAPVPDGLGPSGQRPFGTAGSIGDGPAIEVPVGPQAIIVRAQHVGGTLLSLIEYPIESVGFAAACGATPPVTIAVGDLLEPIADGPAPGSDRSALANQSVWHHAGPGASVEIRWPADPTLVGRLGPDDVGDGGSIGFVDSPDGASDTAWSSHVIGSISGAAGECGLVEITAIGDRTTVDWWGGALSAMWSFGLPLDISELDPALGPEGIGGDDPGSDDGGAELVVDTIRADAAPLVAEAGSCDGLPDAPPRRGGATDTIWDAPTSALVTTIDAANAENDPPLPATGYTEVVIDDDTISYVIGTPTDPTVVVNVERSGVGWRLAGWEASPC
ncbi:MAG: hypothetical protein AAGA93_07510 [Actinomycetota bacterium]